MTRSGRDERNRCTTARAARRVRSAEPYFFTSTLIEERPVVVNDRQNAQPLPSPDGKRLAFVEDMHTLRVLDRASGRVVTLLTEQHIFGGGQFEWSPDGRWMAYITRNGGGAFRLQLMDLSSGTVTALTDTNDDESPSFAPNSRLIIYASRSGGRDVLMTTTLDGSIKARLSPPMVDVREPVWGPFGR